MKLWPEIKAENLLQGILKDHIAVRAWNNNFEYVFKSPVSKIWDYQWTFACWIQNSLGIVSSENLISNIGWGSDSTHFTSNQLSPYINMPTKALEFPLKHPPFVIANFQADKFTQKTMFNETPKEVIKNEIKKILKGLNITQWKAALGYLAC